jgi:hypothetical protein
MSNQAASTFKIDSWDERAYVETEEGEKLTRAHVKQTFEGEIDGKGEVEWLMCYRRDDTAEFVGLQRVVGRLGEREGSLVLVTTGTFDGKEAKGPLRIVYGSGTGELTGITGEGELCAPLGKQPSVSLSYRFD